MVSLSPIFLSPSSSPYFQLVCCHVDQSQPFSLLLSSSSIIQEFFFLIKRVQYFYITLKLPLHFLFLLKSSFINSQTVNPNCSAVDQDNNVCEGSSRPKILFEGVDSNSQLNFGCKTRFSFGIQKPQEDCMWTLERDSKFSLG